ncbi:hypothetical protein [Rhodococcoides navarretei]|uniref:Uncharacterized protein n=1 Tax=Rhodococcus navarretei TaxID=3128981 RepID=A0ABU9D383_9NOCA
MTEILHTITRTVYLSLDPATIPVTHRRPSRANRDAATPAYAMSSLPWIGASAPAQRLSDER